MDDVVSDDAELTIVVDSEDLEWVKGIGVEQGVTVDTIDERGFVDGVSVTLLIIGSAAAVGAVASLLDQRKGGQVFDLRPGAPRFAYRTKDVTHGFVAVIAADGTLTVEVKEPRGMFGQVIDVLGDVLKDATGASTKELKAALDGAIGTDTAAVR